MYQIFNHGEQYTLGERKKTNWAMGKIVNVKQAIKISKQLKTQGKNIVLAGGCFDIIHVGHVIFLRSAKKHGDFLFVLLESDEKVKSLKGDNRPINSQQDRALVISAISYVDFVVKLTNLKTDSEYDKIVTKIHPSIIAVTANDPNIRHKKRQAKLVNGKIACVAKRVVEQSTTRILSLNNVKAL